MRRVLSCLALFLLCGVLVGQSSVADLTKRAEAGDPVAQEQLGRAYDDGNGVEQDYGQALKWYGKAAEQDNPSAQNSLGVMYALGRGVSRDRAEAVIWYKKAAKQGLPEAIYNVAISYYNGDGVEQNYDISYAWLSIALSRGDSQAQEALKRTSEELHGHLDRAKFRLAALYESGQEVPGDSSKAIALYEEIANMSSGYERVAEDAESKLCDLYYAGKDVPQDFIRAKSWCKKAAGGNAREYLVLGRMAEEGLGEPKNLREAVDWYQDAAIMGIAAGFLQAGRLNFQEGSTAGRRAGYFWLYLAQEHKIAGASAELGRVAAYLSQKEIAAEEKKAAAWMRMPQWQRERGMKKH